MLIGCALFLMRGSRPDIAFALSVLGRVVTKWKRCHDRMMDRLMRYLFHHRGKGLHFRINPKDVDTVLLSAALDADHSGAVDTPRSTSGWAVFVAGASTNALVDYAARLQGATAKSTPEAEIVAHADCLTRSAEPLLSLIHI